MKKLLFVSLVSVFFLLPFENARVLLFDVPVYFVEIGVIFSVFFFLILRNEQRPRFTETQNLASLPVSPLVRVSGGTLTKDATAMTLKMSIPVLLFGVLSSTLVAAFSHTAPCPLTHEGLFHALGIFKSWFVFPILFGYILFHASRTHFSRNTLISVFTVSFLPVYILSSLGWVFGSGMTYDGRLEGFFNSPNALALYLTPAAILSWYFFRIHPSRFLFIIYNLSLIILLFLTRSYSAWIAVSVALLFFEIMRIRNIRVRANHHSPLHKGMFLFLIFATIIFSQWNSPRFEQFFNPDSRSSFASRVMIWKSAGAMIADSPIFGIGPGNFQSCYLSYQKYFPPYLEWSAPEPHNLFLAFWLGSGLIGLLAFCFLIGWWFRALFLALKTTKKEHRQILFAQMAIMLAILVHGLFDTPYWRTSLAYVFWIVFFLGISSSRHSRENGNPVTTS